MVEPFCLNFRAFTVKLVGVQKFRKFTVNRTMNRLCHHKEMHPLHYHIWVSYIV